MGIGIGALHVSVSIILLVIIGFVQVAQGDASVTDPDFIVEELVTGIKAPTQMTFVGNDIVIGAGGNDVCLGGPGSDTLKSCEVT